MHISNGLHLDKLQMNIISEDRSHHYDQNDQKIIQIRQISLGFDQFKVWKSLGAPVRSGRWNAGEASKFSLPGVSNDEWKDPRTGRWQG